MNYLKEKKEYKIFHRGANLQQLVDDIICRESTRIAAVRSGIINEICASLVLKTVPEIVESVISSILDNLLESYINHQILITAKEYGNIVLIHIKDYNYGTGSSLETLPFSIINKAKLIKGYVGITRHHDNTTVFAFSFPNLPVAA